MLLGACRGQAFLAAYFFAASVAAGSVVARLAALLLEREEAAVEAAIIDSTTWLHKADLFDTGGVTEADYGERAVEPTTVRRNSPLTHRFARKRVFSRSLEHHSVFPLSRAPRVPVIAMRPGTRHVVPRRRCASSIRWCPCTLALMRLPPPPPPCLHRLHGALPDASPAVLFKLQQMQRVDDAVLARLARRFDELDTEGNGVLTIGVEVPSARQVAALAEILEARGLDLGAEPLALHRAWLDIRHKLAEHFIGVETASVCGPFSYSYISQFCSFRATLN